MAGAIVPADAAASAKSGIIVSGEIAQGTSPEGYDLLKAKALLVGSQAAGIDAEVAQLISAYSPVLAVFPEGSGGEDAPYPNGRHDYHPRPAEIYLNEARSIPLLVATWPRAIGAVPVVGLSWGVLFALFTAMFGEAVSRSVLIPWSALFGLSVILYLLFQAWRPPPGVDRIRTQLAADMHNGLKGFTLTTSRWPGGRTRDKAWRDYGKTLAKIGNDPSMGRTAYVRVVRGTGLAALAIEYWFFYYYNDWWDAHEADWESVTLFFQDPHSAEQTPVAAAYSCHVGAVWRAWDKVRKWPNADARSHPIVYVARGSHANYFDPRRGGYLVSSYVPNPLLRFRLTLGGVTATGADRDHVPLVSIEEVQSFADEQFLDYELRPFPARPDFVDPADDPETWHTWWWLRLRSKWATYFPGGIASIEGPPLQQSRWDTPFAWVSEDGQADDLWEDLFD